jgi:hypothetical protein
VSILKLVIPAKAGIHLGPVNMDSRVRGNDERTSKHGFRMDAGWARSIANGSVTLTVTATPESATRSLIVSARVGIGVIARGPSPVA